MSHRPSPPEPPTNGTDNSTDRSGGGGFDPTFVLDHANPMQPSITNGKDSTDDLGFFDPSFVIDHTNPIQSTQPATWIPKYLELELKISKTRREKCRIVCGSGEIVLLFFLLWLCGSMNLYAWIEYGGFSTDRAVIFFLIAMVDFLLFFVYLYRTVALIAKSQKPNKRDPSTKSLRRLQTTVFKRMNRCRRALDLNGQYYLLKLHAMEIFEHVNQTINFITVYSCSLAPWATFLMAVLLIAETSWTTYNMFYLKSSIARDRQIAVDIISDLFCVLFPCLLIYTVFDIPISLIEMIQIGIIPLCYMALKIRSLLREMQRIGRLKLKYNDEMVRENAARKPNKRVRRVSVLHPEESAIFQQMKALSFLDKWFDLRWFFLIVNVGFIIFFSSLVIVQAATLPTDDVCNNLLATELWEKCLVQVPFCQDPYVGHCDCAVFETTNYSRQELPEAFGKMKSLLKIKIVGGQLRALPVEFGQNHRQLKMLTIEENQLKELPQSVAETSLIKLYLRDNLLESLPLNIGKVRLAELDISGNRFTTLPADEIGKLDNLGHLFISNNELTSLPKEIGQLHELVRLEANRNHFSVLPDSIGRLIKLERVTFANNSLSMLPDSIGELIYLQYASFKDNQLSVLPESIRQWKNIKSLYMDGNPLCLNGYDFPPNVMEAAGLCNV